MVSKVLKKKTKKKKIIFSVCFWTREERERIAKFFLACGMLFGVVAGFLLKRPHFHLLTRKREREREEQ